jgi:spermidine synthase
MLLIYTAATFLAAALLFAIEPFAARQALPLFGGSPAVWNTAVMFFQVGLLGGYIYAHLLTAHLPRRTQFGVHAIVLCVAAALPVGLPADALTDPEAQAGTGRLLVLLARGVGLPFFAVASAGPLLQRWFASTGHRAAGDPYFLYAASNSGSFVGLLAYPFIIERVWSLPEQAVWWRGGFVAFALLLLTAALSAKPSSGPVRPDPVKADPVGWRRRGWWVFLAFVPSSLMLGVTQYISTDLAAAPLLWIIPLALYLLTFIAAFSRFGDAVTRVAARTWPIAVVAVVLALVLEARRPLLAIVGLHLVVLVAAGCLCHGRLRACRPGVSRLTEFYLFLAIGGALGGVFNSLLAPLLFNALHEYPVTIVLACLALPLAETSARPWSRALWVLPAALLGWVWIGPRPAPSAVASAIDPALLFAAGLPVLVLFVLSRRRALFTAAAAAMLLGLAVRGDGSRIELRERTFFGMHSVRIEPTGRFRELRHGTTVHGIESLDPARRGEPLAYYHSRGPAGQVFGALGERFERVGFVGLGAGSLAAYGRAGQQFDFFEIDPSVIRIARDPTRFSFLADCAADVRYVVGDGRLTLANEPDGAYGVIVLDAFSSDAVPLHLLTREAIEMYAAKLTPGGALLFHISNRHFNLSPFIAAAINDLGMTAREREDFMTREEMAETARFGSRWLVAVRDTALLEPFANDVRWKTPTPADRAWTDAHSDLVAALLSD